MIFEIIEKVDFESIEILLRAEKLKRPNFLYQDVKTNFILLIWYM